MTYAPAKFEVATSNGLRNTFTKTTLFDLDLWVTQNAAQYPLHHVTYGPAKFEVEVQRFRRRCIYKKVHYLTCNLDLGVRAKVTRNIPKYPLHFVTFAPAKFEIAMSNCLG